jgi:hypothetical protein
MRQIALAASVGAVVGCLSFILAGRMEGRVGPPPLDERPSAVREVEITELPRGDLAVKRRTFQVQSVEIAGEENISLEPATDDTLRITLRGRGKPVMLLARPTANQSYPYPTE